MNGFSGLPGAPKGSIDYMFKFTVDSKGEVSLVNGGHKAYPSYGVCSYKRDELIPQTLHESSEHDIGDLTHPFNGLTDTGSDPPP